MSRKLKDFFHDLRPLVCLQPCQLARLSQLEDGGSVKSWEIVTTHHEGHEEHEGNKDRV
jgi:hypothetical protein